MAVGVLVAQMVSTATAESANSERTNDGMMFRLPLPRLLRPSVMRPPVAAVERFREFSISVRV